jgi:hypothetical protein
MVMEHVPLKKEVLSKKKKTTFIYFFALNTLEKQQMEEGHSILHNNKRVKTSR